MGDLYTTGIGLATNTSSNPTVSSGSGNNLTRLSASHYDLSANHRALKSTVSDLSASHYDLSANHDALKTTVSDLSASHYDLSGNHRALKSTVSDLSASHYDLSRNHLALKNNVNDLSASHYDLSRNHVALKSTVSDLSASHFDLSRNHVALKSTVNDLSASHYDLSANHRALKTLVTDLSTNNNIRFNNIDTSLSQVYTKTQSDSIFVSKSNIDLSNLSTNIIPSTDNTYKIGDISKNWRNAYIKDISATNIDITNNLNVRGSTQLTNTLNVNGNVTLNGPTLYAPSTFTIDPFGHDNNTGTVFINGNLTVQGLTTTINSTTIDISDKTILLASNAKNSIEATGAGFEISGANVNFIYDYPSSAFRSSIGLSISGNVVPANSTNVNLGVSGNIWKIAYIDELNVNSFTNSINGANITSETITSTQIMNNTIVDGDISNNAAIAFSKINATNAIVDSDISANANILGSKLANNSITSDKINQSNNWTFSQLTSNTALIRDISASNISISGNIIPLDNSSSDLGSLTKRFNKIFTNDLSVNTINGQAYNATTAIDLTSVSGNIIPSLNNTFRLGDTSRNWNNAYIKDISATNISVSGDIIPSITFGVNTRGTGGTITICGEYVIHTFTTNGIFKPVSNRPVEVLLVGGGGGGGMGYPNLGGGGGGGGGVIYIPAALVNSMVEYSVVVGNGGEAFNNGGNTSVFGAIAAGGGGGGGYANGTNGLSGGSGGGAQAPEELPLTTGGASINSSLGPNSGIIYGNSGGSCTTVSNTSATAAQLGAGGGGAGASGATTNSNILTTSQTGNGSGGIGVMNNILGPNYYWGGGGGGGSNNGHGGWGGIGGGGGGRSYFGQSGPGGGSALNPPSSHGGTNTGGGGGGSNWRLGLPGLGGSGIVIIRYAQVSGSSLGTFFNPWSLSYMYDINAININVTSNLNPLFASTGNLGNSSKPWGNSNINNLSVGSINVTNSVNPLTTLTGSIGTTAKPWGNAVIRDLSIGSIDVGINVYPSLPNSGSLGLSNKRWANAFVNDLSVSTINGQAYSAGTAIDLTSVSGNIIPSLNNTFRLGDISRNWSNAYIHDISATNISVSGNIIFSVSGNSMRIAADTSTNSITSTHRIYQNISGDLSWAAVNGHYGLAKDAYPRLNSVSSGAKAVSTWTRRTTDIATDFQSICWSPKLMRFVAVGDGRSIYSLNGINWPGLFTGGGDLYREVCWSHELEIFVAVCAIGSNNISRSSTGTGWSTVTANTTGLVGVCWSAELGIFVAVGDSGTRVRTSKDGITWSEPSISQPPPLSSWNTVCWSAELCLFVAVANASTSSGRVMISNNGSNWQEIIVELSSWQGVCWSKQLGLFVAVADGGNNRVMISNNGITWKSINVPSYSYTCVCWSAELGIFVAGADYNIVYSANGINWTLVTISNSVSYFRSISWSPELGIFTAAGNNLIMTSSFKGRLPTGYNVFDGNFNSIDETGNWTFAAIDINTNLNPTIPDSGNLGLSNKRWANAFVNDLSVTRINGQAYSAGGGLTANSVNSSHIIDGSILGTDISNNTITANNIADNTITETKLATAFLNRIYNLEYPGFYGSLRIQNSNSSAAGTSITFTLQSTNISGVLNLLGSTTLTPNQHIDVPLLIQNRLLNKDTSFNIVYSTTSTSITSTIPTGVSVTTPIVSPNIYFSVLPNFIHNGTIALSIVLPAPGPVVISITSIATWDAANNRYTLDGNRTINAGEVLNLPDSSNKLRIENGFTLTNNGTINLSGSSELRCQTGTLINNGIINVSGGNSTIFGIVDTFNNYGTVNNSAFMSITGVYNNYGTITHTGGTFQNNGIFNNNTGATLTSTATVLTGTTNNTGIIKISGPGYYGISFSGTFNNNNGGIVYVYTGGAIYNSGVFNNFIGATLNLANGSGNCGSGTISKAAVGSGTIGTACPPPP